MAGLARVLTAATLSLTTTSTFCVAAGEHTTQVFTYGGDGWTATDSSTTVNVVLSRLSCGSTAFCVGVSGSFAYVGRVP